MEQNKKVATKLEELREAYKSTGKKVYEVTITIEEDDESKKELGFIFRKPNTASYDRYMKMASASSTKAIRTFIQDNIVPEQEEELRDVVEEYPASAISIGEKLLYMLGLSKATSVKKL
jgi:hypothetical protein